MILTVEELRTFVETNLSNDVLEAELSAVEAAIRKVTNNNFQNRAMRCESAIVDGVISTPSIYFAVGDTVQITKDPVNAGLYVIDNGMMLSPIPYNSERSTITKIVYPKDVVMGVIEIMKWKLRNADANSGDTSRMPVQSETISRHSVTYQNDGTESDLNAEIGVPKKYAAFLKRHTKARF